MGTERRQPSQKQVLRRQRKKRTEPIMNKSLFLSCSLILLVVFLAAQAEGKKRSFIERVCKKCEYCKDDPQCDGCKKCVECVSGVKMEGCRFCKAEEDEAACRERCNKGCNICKGKDGTGLESCKKLK